MVKRIEMVGKKIQRQEKRKKKRRWRRAIRQPSNIPSAAHKNYYFSILLMCELLCWYHAFASGDITANKLNGAGMQYTNWIQHLWLFIENNSNSNNEKKWKPFQAKMKKIKKRKK